MGECCGRRRVEEERVVIKENENVSDTLMNQTVDFCVVLVVVCESPQTNPVEDTRRSNCRQLNFTIKQRLERATSF